MAGEVAGEVGGWGGSWGGEVAGTIHNTKATQNIAIQYFVVLPRRQFQDYTEIHVFLSQDV